MFRKLKKNIKKPDTHTQQAQTVDSNNKLRSAPFSATINTIPPCAMQRGWYPIDGAQDNGC